MNIHAGGPLDAQAVAALADSERSGRPLVFTGSNVAEELATGVVFAAADPGPGSDQMGAAQEILDQVAHGGWTPELQAAAANLSDDDDEMWGDDEPPTINDRRERARLDRQAADLVRDLEAGKLTPDELVQEVERLSYQGRSLI